MTTSYYTSNQIGSSTPGKFKPTVLKDDYTRGYINRCCIVRCNDLVSGYEIDPELSSSMDSRLYYVITFQWRVSGQKNRLVINGIIEDFGVMETNTDTLKKQKVPLVRFFPNPLEFWRGN